MKDTDVILKYRRGCDGKICPECDAENSPTATSCSVCGYANMATAPTVKAWSPADEVEPKEVKRPATPPTSTPTPRAGTPGGVDGGPSYTPYTPSSDPAPESDKGIAFWIAVAAIVIAILCIANN